MPPKKNAFYNFMVHRRSQLEGQGEKFPGGWREVSLCVAQEWAQMSPEEKKPFTPNKDTSAVSTSTFDHERNPANEEQNSEGPELPSYDDMTSSIDEDEAIMTAIKEGKNEYFRVDREADASNTYGGRMGKQNVIHRKVNCYESYVAMKITKLLGHGNIPNIPFMMVAFNTWCKTSEKRFVPSEIALLAFTLQSGVIDQYATPIDPGAFPPGFGYEAGVEADKLCFPVPPFDEDCRQYQKICANVLEFIAKNKHGSTPGYLFCFRKDMKVTYSCLQWLNNQTASNYEFHLYPLEFLVTMLSKFANTHSIVFEEELEDRYSLPDKLDPVFLSLSNKEVDREPYYASVSNYSTDSSVNDNDSEAGSDYSSVTLEQAPNGIQNGVGETSQKSIGTGKDRNNSEDTVVAFVDTLMFGSVEFFGCLHHMIYSDVIYLCALNKLNRYAFKIMDLLIIDFGILPVNGLNFIEIKYPNIDEMDKRKKMLENWGLRSKRYPGYITPNQRDEIRAAELAVLIARFEEEGQARTRALDNDNEQVPFYRSRSFHDFIAIDPENQNVPNGIRSRTPSNSTVSALSVPSFISTNTNTNTNDELFSDTDDDGWSYVEDN